MRSQQSSVGQIKCIRVVAGRMTRRCVQRVETVPFGFNIRPVGQRKSQTPQNLHRSFLKECQRMYASDAKRRSWERLVHVAQILRLALRLQGNEPAVQANRYRVSDLI